MMINFKPINLSDKAAITKCLEANTYRACDYSFTNIYAWNAKFKTHFDIVDDTLFLRFTEMDGSIYYMMPIGKMPFEEAFNAVIENAKQLNISFQMKGVSTRMWEDIKTAMPDRFKWTHDRNNDEYIYLTERLISLSGKKLQSKRNHINRFKSDNPDWTYSPITTNEEIEECMNMLHQWGEDKYEATEDKSLRYDTIATRIMLKNLDVLDLKSGLIKVKGKIVAFSIGERLVADTFVVHVEKAFPDINGAYTIINQQFVEHEAVGYTYVNREDDLGIESLRKAKMSYIPDILLQEGVLTLRQNVLPDPCKQTLASIFK